MPNHVTNVIEFDCTVERFTEIAESLKSNPEEPLGQVDFNTLIPMPATLNIESGSRGETGYKAYKKFITQSLPLDDAAKNELEDAYKNRFKNDPEIWELGKQYYNNLMQYGATTWYSLNGSKEHVAYQRHLISLYDWCSPNAGRRAFESRRGRQKKP